MAGHLASPQRHAARQAGGFTDGTQALVAVQLTAGHVGFAPPARLQLGGTLGGPVRLPILTLEQRAARARHQLVPNHLMQFHISKRHRLVTDGAVLVSLRLAHHRVAFGASLVQSLAPHTVQLPDARAHVGITAHISISLAEHRASDSGLAQPAREAG